MNYDKLIYDELVKIRILMEERNPPETSLAYIKQFPDHIRKTIIALADLDGRATATDISEITKRARAIESGILNELERRDIISSTRIGRKKVFILKNK